jgi:2'-5' RNA ligase
VLWFSVEDGPGAALEALARVVDDAVRRRGFPPDDKPWRAHLTVARNPGRKRFEGWEEALRAAGIAGLSTECREVVLFSSRLGSGGPTYASMYRVPLKGPVEGPR